jgi:hypothetical protein
VALNGSTRVARMWKMMNKVVIQDIPEPMNILKTAEYGAFR